LGVSILAILAIIGGVLGLLGSFAILGFGSVATAAGAGILGFAGIGVGVVMLVGSLLNLLFGYGAWNLRPWAWWWGMIANGLPILGALVGLILGGTESLGSAIGSTLLNIIIVVYLLTPGVQRAFGRP
jgi:hypothetical protein